jgi:hypothetical protein
MHWLNENSAAIQALATTILAILTFLYVKLTRDIAKSTSDQLQHMKELVRVDQQQYASALAYFAFHLRVAIGKLPDIPTREKLTGSFFLTESDITELRILARKVNGKAVGLAIQATISLRMIHGIMQRSKEESWQPTEQEKKDWKTARENSERALHALQEECVRVAGIDINSLAVRA